jgi:hypothetical protein
LKETKKKSGSSISSEKKSVRLMVEAEGTINIHTTVSDYEDEASQKKIKVIKKSPKLSAGDYSIELEKKELAIQTTITSHSSFPKHNIEQQMIEMNTP